MFPNTAAATADHTPSVEISREEVGIRALMTLLFVLIAIVAVHILAIIVVFELAYSLVTRCLPEARVRRFAGRLIDYCRDVARYLTFNREQPPFPFDEIPER